MSPTALRLPCYLVEWYRAELAPESIGDAFAKLDECAAAMSTDDSPTKVLLTFAVPTDEVIFCVFVASSADAVGEACARAGLPAERVTAAVAAPFA
jgi:hypothetical protein